MKIAITDLKDYNEGILRFEWLDLEEYSTAEEIGSYIESFLAKRSKETKDLIRMVRDKGFADKILKMAL